MNIAITGASGFLGYHLISLLVRDGHQVTAIALDATRSPALKRFNIEKHDLDIRDTDGHRALFQGKDVVYHLASVIDLTNRHTAEVFSINVDGTQAVAQAALDAGIKRFIYVSSIHALDRNPLDVLIDESRPLALDDPFDYDRSKACAEVVLQTYSQKGLNVITANLTGLWGPEDYIPSIMGLSLMSFMKQKRCMFACNGGFNFVDVRDAAQTLVHMLEKGQPGECYIIGGEWYHSREMAEFANRAAGLRAPVLLLPEHFARIILPLNRLVWKILGMRELYTAQSVVHLKSHRHISDQKARSVLGHTSRPITETMRDMYAWMQQSAP